MSLETVAEDAPRLCTVCHLPLGRWPEMRTFAGIRLAFCCHACASAYYVMQLLAEHGRSREAAGEAANP